MSICRLLPCRDILKQLNESVLSGQEKHFSVFNWPGHAGGVGKWCSTCSKCATRKMPPNRGCAPLQEGISSGYPLQIVAVDIVGSITLGEAGNQYILVASDYFTRWSEASVIPNQEATTVAIKLVDEFFCRFCIPSQHHSDQSWSSSPMWWKKYVKYYKYVRHGWHHAIPSRMFSSNSLTVHWSVC